MQTPYEECCPYIPTDAGSLEALASYGPPTVAENMHTNTVNSRMMFVYLQRNSEVQPVVGRDESSAAASLLQRLSISEVCLLTV